jgi:hypothetical protein
MQRCGLVKNTPTEGIEPSAIRLKAGRSATELCGWCVSWCTCTRVQIGTPKLSYKTKTKTNAPTEGLEPPTSRLKAGYSQPLSYAGLYVTALTAMSI